MSHHILLVDDDALLRRSLAFNLEKAGYQVSAAASAEDALALATREHPDLVLLDIGLPGMDGLEALRRFQRHCNAPVIFLTARRRELDQVLGLEARRRRLRYQALRPTCCWPESRPCCAALSHRLSANNAPEPLVVGDITVDPGAHTVSVAGQAVDLTPREFDLLCALALSAGHVLSVDDIITRSGGAIRRPVRRRLRPYPLAAREDGRPAHPRAHLHLRGVGYKLEMVG